jgi:hypothetical protein
MLALSYFFFSSMHEAVLPNNFLKQLNFTSKIVYKAIVLKKQL